MAQKVTVTITAGGKKFSGGEIQGKIGGENPFQSLRISQRMDWHHSFEINLSLEEEGHSSGNQWLLNNLKGLMGQRVEIDISGTEQQYFKGILSSLAFERYPGNVREVVLRGESPTILLEEGIHCRSFTKMKPKDIATRVIAGAHANDLENDINPQYKKEIPYWVQYKETSYRFLSRLAAQYGEWFYYNGQKLIMGRPEASAALPLSIDRDLSSFELSVKVAPTKFKVRSYNYEKDEVYNSTSNPAIEDLDTIGKMVQDVSNQLYATDAFYYTNQDLEDAKQLDDLAKGRKATITRDFVTATGVSDNPGVTIGGLICVDGYGEFRVISVNHSVSGTGDYQNQFEAIPADATYPPPNRHLENPHCETQPALVTDVEDEKDKDNKEQMGRVRVKFYWQENDEKTPWIRLANAYAGKDRGFYFLPEVGDQVLVAFEHDSPLEPYVIGSMYHAKTQPKGDWMKDGKKNDYKAIRTRSGNEIYFFDKQGKEEIKIFNRNSDNEISLSLEGGGKIRIKTKGKLEINAKSISMTAEDDIKIKSGTGTEVEAGKELKITSGEGTQVQAGKEIKIASALDTAMEAQNMNVAVQQKFALDGQEISTHAMKTAINSDNSLELEAGATASMKAGASLNLESGAAGNLKAAKLDIDGGVSASMKAAVIQLN